MGFNVKSSLKNTIWETVQIAISSIQVAIGKAIFVIVLAVCLYFLENILKPHPNINRIFHHVECNQYGVCDK